MADIQRKYIMYPHGGSGNHGCEAIVRTTVGLLGDNKQILLFSDDIDEDKKYIKNPCFEIVSSTKEVKRTSFSYIKAFIRYHLLKKKDAYDVLAFQSIIASCMRDDILLSIGGDNYCYGDNEHIYLINSYARKNKCKTVLWGCSVGKEDLTNQMIKDLAAFDLIIARESLSYDNLKKINPNTVLVPDPAFTLEVSEGVVPEGLFSKPVIGINISPMIISKEKKDGITIKNYIYLIEKIISETDCNVALIPHVVKLYNDDRTVINELYKHISDKNRAYIVSDQNCEQLKSIISKCECFVGARTHATIAAYSTCVPTLVVGYSIKARGIAKDLFRTEKGYVYPVQNFSCKEDLYKAFSWIWRHRSEIRKKLDTIIPEYINHVKTINQILEEGLR